MRLLVDECTGPKVAVHLRQQGHDVVSVYEVARGATDDDVLSMSVAQDRVLITNDHGFGESVFRRRLPHAGVILLRLEMETTARKIEVIDRLLERWSEQLKDRFVVASEQRVRIRPPLP